MSTIRAVGFDAAETLFTLTEPVGETYARFAGDYGATLSASALEQGFRELFPRMPPLGFPGLSGPELDNAERDWWRSLVSQVVQHAGGVHDFERYFGAVYAHFAGDRAWQVFPEVHAVLQELRARGLQLVVISNFDSRLLGILEDMQLTGCFDAIVYSSSAGSAKPDREIFARAATALGISCNAMLHVGDNPRADFEGARAAGLEALLVRRGCAGASADHTVSSLTDILDRVPAQV